MVSCHASDALNHVLSCRAIRGRTYREHTSAPFKSPSSHRPPTPRLPLAHLIVPTRIQHQRFAALRRNNSFAHSSPPSTGAATSLIFVFSRFVTSGAARFVGFQIPRPLPVAPFYLLSFYTLLVFRSRQGTSRMQFLLWSRCSPNPAVAVRAWLVVVLRALRLPSADVRRSRQHRNPCPVHFNSPSGSLRGPEGARFKIESRNSSRYSVGLSASRPSRMLSIMSRSSRVS